METTETKAPAGAAFTLIVPLNRQKSEKAVFHIAEMKEDVFLAAKAMIDKGKDFDAVRMIIKALHVGGDPVELLKDNFIATQAASRLVLEFMEPIDGELKKN